MKLCRCLSPFRQVIVRSYRRGEVECSLELSSLQLTVTGVSAEYCWYMWDYCAVFSSVLFITDLFGFYLCSFLFLLPHDLTHPFCCWCLRQMILEVSVVAWSSTATQKHRNLNSVILRISPDLFRFLVHIAYENNSILALSPNEAETLAAFLWTQILGCFFLKLVLTDEYFLT